MSKILIIDDDKEVCRILSRGFGRVGHDVATSSNGVDGLAAVAAEIPDLILCDLDMPGLDGQGVVAALREDSRFSEIPIIFLSACSDRDQIRRSINLGGDDFIIKPSPWPEILAAVEARLSRTQKQRRYLERQVEQAAEVFVGIIHDLNKSAPEIRWLADATSVLDDRKNRIIQKVQQSLSANKPSTAGSPAAPPRPASVLVKDNHRQQMLKLSEVKALMACGEYSNVYWGRNQRIMFRKPLKQWMVELPPEQFIRVHRQAIINLAFLDFVEKDAAGKMQIHMREFQQVIPVSQREKSTFNRCLKKFKRVG